MSIFTGIIVYLMLYWLVLYWVLPWGNTPTGTTEGGTIASAPKNPRIIKKFIITGCLTAIVWSIVYLLIESGMINFYEMAREMRAEDLK